jgi:hypothetical protein
VYLDTRGADLDDLLGAVHLPPGAVERVVQPASRLRRLQVHERVPHVAALAVIDQAAKDFDQDRIRGFLFSAGNIDHIETSKKHFY